MGAVFSNFALIYLSSSLYQMMKSLLLVFICLWSKIFLHNDIYKHHLLGIGCLIFGLILGDVSALLYREEDISIAEHPIKGIILIILSQLFFSGVYIIQEIFIKHYDIHASQIVGFEGLWGIIIFTLLLIIFQFIPCDNWDIKEEICTKNDKKKYLLEDSIFALRQMWEKKSIFILYLLYIISVSFFNVFGVKLTILVSSTARAVVDNARSVVVWLFFLFIETAPDTKERFRIVQFIGLLFLVFGTLVYNEIIVLPFWGLDYNIRPNLVKRQKERFIKKLEEEDDDDEFEENREKKLYMSVQGKDSIAYANQNENH